MIFINTPQLAQIDGGEEGIRTLDTIAREHAFQAGALNHSATSPYIKFKTIYESQILYQNYIEIKLQLKRSHFMPEHYKNSLRVYDLKIV